MGLFDLLFKNRPKEKGRYEGIFKMLNGYTPHFTSWSGNLYEQELIRATIGATAAHISKLKIEINGSANPALRNKLQHRPNSLQTWSQFLRRLATLLEVHNTAYIVPIYDSFGNQTGIFSPLPQRCEVVQYSGQPYLRYTFANGEAAAMELEECGIMVQHQYRDDLIGESNAALYPTMDLIAIQNQGIKEGVKSSATYRFMATLGNWSSDKDVAKERKRFTEQNFGPEAEADGGILLFPYGYENVKQVDTKPWVIDSEQVKTIREGVFEYFGTNEKILKNEAFGDDWSAFYEGKIETFAIQFSEVVTNMFFSLREQSQGNKVLATANRLQYLSNKEKLNVSSQTLDRGIMSINEVREIWNLPPVEGGDKRIIRGEYYDAKDKLEGEKEKDGEIE